MKILTGKVQNGTIVLDGPAGLPDQTRVKVIVASAGPAFDERTPIRPDKEELDLARASRRKIGKVTREECG